MSIIEDMSPERYRLCGLHTLTSTQRTFLDRWFDTYVSIILEESFKNIKKYHEDYQYQKHHVLKSFEQGGIVILEDETIWRIHGMDPYSSTKPWYLIQHFTIMKIKYSLFYVFENKENDAIALADYIGKL